jgi:hypothetical protein
MTSDNRVNLSATVRAETKTLAQQMADAENNVVSRVVEKALELYAGEKHPKLLKASQRSST